MYCKKCGKQVPNASEMCPYCREILTDGNHKHYGLCFFVAVLAFGMGYWFNSDAPEEDTVRSGIAIEGSTHKTSPRKLEKASGIKYLQDGMRYLEDNDYDKAIYNLSKAEKLGMISDLLYCGLGQSYYGKLDYDNAEKYLNKALDMKNKNDVAHYYCGLVNCRKEDYVAALRHFSKCVELNPKNVKALERRGLLYVQFGRYDDAVRDFSKLIELDPSSVLAKFERCKAYFELGMYDEAITDCSECIVNDNRDVRYYLLRASAYKALKREEECVNDLKTVLILDSRNVDAKSFLANYYDSKGDWKQSVKEYTELLEIDPNYNGVYLKRGIAYRKLGEFDSSIKDLNIAVDTYSAKDEVLCERGVTYFEQGKQKDAISDFKQSIESNWEYDRSYYGLLNTFERYDLLPDAITFFRELIAKNEKNLIARKFLGDSLYLAKNYTDAIEEYDRVLAIDSNYSAALANKESAIKARVASWGGLDILDVMSQDELKVIVEIMYGKWVNILPDFVKDKMSSDLLEKMKKLTNSLPEGFRDRNFTEPDNSRIIGHQLLLFAGNSIPNWSRGHGVDYGTMLRDVCDKLDIEYEKYDSENQLELLLVKKNREEFDKKGFSEKNMSFESVVNGAGTIYDITSTVVWYGGFQSYVYASALVNGLSKLIIGQGLSFAANAALKHYMSVLLSGPFAEFVAAFWVVYDILNLTGPAYSVTIPVTNYIVEMRQVYLNAPLK